MINGEGSAGSVEKGLASIKDQVRSHIQQSISQDLQVQNI